MRYFIALLLAGCSAQNLSPARPGDVLLTPVTVKAGPKPFESGSSGISIDWGDRKFRIYSAASTVKGYDANWQRMYGFGPVIEVSTKKTTALLDLRERFPSYVVERVFHDQWNERLWIFLQGGIEGPSSSYTVWITEDAGEHWFRGADLERPAPRFPPSDLYTIFVDNLGKGEAWFKLDASHATPNENVGAHMAQGQEYIYKASTSDGGRSWKVGREPVLRNGMIEAAKGND